MISRSSRVRGDVLARLLGRHSVPGGAVPLLQATPESEDAPLDLPQGERIYTMFVQTARGGTWTPDPNEEGSYTLTLTGLPAQTVYFSDRPSRVVGMQATPDFLDVLGFGPDNPPNAALVTTTDGGAPDVLVIELFDPSYTQGDDGATLVYRARILANYVGTDLGRIALSQDDAAIPAEFAGASLFIDDCVDGAVSCLREGYALGKVYFGCCYSFPACKSCHGETAPYVDVCKRLPECADGGCGSDWSRDCGFVN